MAVAKINYIKRTKAKSANPRKIDAIKIKTPERKEKIEQYKVFTFTPLTI